MVFIDEQKFRTKIGIYKIENIINGKVYVGQTAMGFQKRFWFHCWKLNNGIHDNSHLQHSWDKYGSENFIFSVLEIVPKEEMNEREKYWIKYYRDSDCSYNIQDGGQEKHLIQYVKPESRKRIGEINRKRMLGAKLSKETRIKMSKTRHGKYVSKKTDQLNPNLARKVKLALMTGLAASDIALYLGVSYHSVNGILSSDVYKYVHVDGWDEYFISRPRTKRRSSSEVECIIQEYFNCKDAKFIADKYGITTKYLYQLIRIHKTQQ